MRSVDDLLMRFGVTGVCSDCGEERLLLPVDDGGADYCCTGCDGAVTMPHLTQPVGRSRPADPAYAAPRAG